jgi:hypothetical protein
MSRLSTAQTRKVLALNKPFGLTKRHMVVAEVGTGAAISECPVSQNAPCRNPARPEIRPFRPNGPAKRPPGAPICEIRMTPPPRHRVRARATQRDRKGRHCNLRWGVARFLNRNTRKRRASWSPLSRAPRQEAADVACHRRRPGSAEARPFRPSGTGQSPATRQSAPGEQPSSLSPSLNE